MRRKRRREQNGCSTRTKNIPPVIRHHLRRGRGKDNGWNGRETGLIRCPHFDLWIVCCGQLIYEYTVKVMQLSTLDDPLPHPSMRTSWMENPQREDEGEDYLSSGPVMNFLSAATTLSGGEGPFLFVSRMLQRIKYMFEFGGSLSRTKSLRDCEHANNATRGADKVSSPCRSMKKPFLLLSCFHFVYSISHEKEGRRESLSG